MGLSGVLARLAVRAAKVLVVETPGHWLTRVELEQQMLRRGWRPAWTPAEADVLAVCGVPGPELAELADRLWEQMPGPRVRVDIASPADASSALDDVVSRLLDTEQHRADARERAQQPEIPEDHSGMDHGEHEDMDHVGHEDMGHEDMDQDRGEGHEDHSEHDEMDHDAHAGMNHGGMDHGQTDHSGHGGMDHDSHEDMGLDDGEGHEDHSEHGGMDHSGHGGMDHGGMDMAPEGIPLAQGGEDRDGLEMDVLHLPLGPVLPFWPAGLVLRCSLQGDVVVDAEASVVDGNDHRAGTLLEWPGDVPAAAVRCDNAERLLALAGAEDAAARARRARDTLLHGDQDAARDAVDRLRRTVRRSRVLRWSLRNMLPLDGPVLERHGLPESCRGDAYDRLLSSVARISAEFGGEGSMPVDDTVVPWEIVPDLVTGLELGSVRLAVASLDLAPFPAVPEVKHA